jgi:hypothetical protein
MENGQILKEENLNESGGEEKLQVSMPQKHFLPSSPTQRLNKLARLNLKCFQASITFVS